MWLFLVAIGFYTLKRGFSRSQCYKATHGIKQFRQSRMIPLDLVEHMFPIDVADFITRGGHGVG